MAPGRLANTCQCPARRHRGNPMLLKERDGHALLRESMRSSGARNSTADYEPRRANQPSDGLLKIVKNGP